MFTLLQLQINETMAGPDPSPSPKILLAKPALVTGGTVAGKFSRGGAAEEDSSQLRSRLPSVASLNLLSDSWDFHFDRFLPVRNNLQLLNHIFFLLKMLTKFQQQKSNRD